ncbi:EAL domain-containing protein [Lysobacter pythonis]|uniref:EAL domain-containing protein n=1 Tax=Solilutibacter pythonis TaxID=2483112 RepID=A0A3M2HTA8_9GAMM|nr:EAL domain-containing protein [Lysobacter pythonis]RMH92981.1 EAL domain-containing protein [Lysobacter pythonis]
MPKGADAPIRILVVNDDVAEAEATVSNLRNFGMSVRPSRPANVGELSTLLDSHAFDLVLLSSPANVVSDAETFRLVEASGKDLPLLVEVPRIDDATLLALTAAGARGVVPRGRFEYLRDIVAREFDDLSARRGLRKLEGQLSETERRCDALIESSRDPIAYVHEGMYIRANGAYLEMFGYDDFGDIEGMSLLDMVAPAHVTEFKQLLKDLSKGEAPPRHELQMRDSHGHDFPAVMEFTQAKYEGEPCLQVVIRRQEIDPALAAEVEELRRRDMATGLLNRQTFLQYLDQYVAEAARGENEHALLLIELDQIALLRQQVGLDNIDDLAAAVADRLRETLGTEMLIARISENTYAVPLANSQYRQTLEVAERIRLAFNSRLLETTEKTLSTTVSVGGAQIGERIAQVSRVLTKASESLQYANSVGGNQVQVFDPRETERAEEERIAAWTTHIRDSITNDALVLHYQAIVNLHDETEQFHESLLRMNASDGHLLLPDQFVPLAEEHGLSNVIDRWTIRHALKEIRIRQDRGMVVRILAKISQLSLDDATLLADIERMLKETGVPADRLVLQLPESKIFTNLRSAQRFNDGLGKLGASFCIEHFGTGLNSLQMLSHVQPRFLKLNEDFIEDFSESQENLERITEIVTAADSLNIPCIARGVKDAATMTALFTAGVKYMQGDFIAPLTEQLP